MALGVLNKFWSSKSVKLSDAFEVLISLDEGMALKPLVSCTGFTIPKFESEEETLEYGNVAQIFLTPKYDSCKELTLEFIETMQDQEKYDFMLNGTPGSAKIKNEYSHIITNVFLYMGYKLHQKYGDDGLSVNYANYIDREIPVIEIKILDNKLWKYIYKYHFENLKIVNYSIYNLDYQNESPCKVSVTFSFESYKKEFIDEDVDYGKSTQKNPDTSNNDNKDKKEEQKPNPTKEDIEQQWRNDMNQDDLDMIRGEQLFDPSTFDLPDLDDEETEPKLDVENSMEREAGMEDTSTSNTDVGTETAEEDWRAKAYEAQQAAKGNRSPDLTQNPNPETIDNVKTNTDVANKTDPNELKKQLTKNDKMENIENQMKAQKDENSLLWEKHTENGETYTDKYIQTTNGHTVDATYNQQQYEATQRANEQKAQSMTRGSSTGTNGSGDTRNASQEASNASAKTKEAADQREYQRKTDEYAKQNKGNRGAVPPTKNISVAQQSNDTESFYKNGA